MRMRRLTNDWSDRAAAGLDEGSGEGRLCRARL